MQPINELTGWTATAATNTVEITTPVGVKVEYTATEDDANGQIVIVNNASDGDTIGGTSARATFTVDATADTITITAPGPGGVGTVTICSNVAKGATANDTAQAIVNAINATVTNPRYTAARIGAAVTVYLDADEGVETGNLTITWTGGGDNITAGGATPSLSASVTPAINSVLEYGPMVRCTL